MYEPTVESIQSVLDARVATMTPERAAPIVAQALHRIAPGPEQFDELCSELDIVERWLKAKAEHEYMVKHYHEQ